MGNKCRLFYQGKQELTFYIFVIGKISFNLEYRPNIIYLCEYVNTSNPLVCVHAYYLEPEPENKQ